MAHIRKTWLAFALLLAPTSPALAATRCLTDEEKSLGRLQTLCADGTRAESSSQHP